MSSKGTRLFETRGQYRRCEIVGCKRKAESGDRCRSHAVMRDRYGTIYDPAESLTVRRQVAALSDSATCPSCGKPWSRCTCTDADQERE